jgi:hypothetical protein
MIAALVLVAAGSPPILTADQQETGQMTAAEPIWVESEWAELRECVYGSREAWVLPRFLADSKLRAQGEFGRFWESHQGEDMAVASPEMFSELSTPPATLCHPWHPCQHDGARRALLFPARLRR